MAQVMSCLFTIQFLWHK